jgi:phosphoglycolate phosphatase
VCAAHTVAPIDRFDYVRNECSLDFTADKFLMIGDRCNTDILFATRHHMKSLLVLTGCTTESLLDDYVSDGKTDWLPDFVAPSLQEVADALDTL